MTDYRIRALTESELNVSVKKDLQRQREFERGILHNYKMFLQVRDIASLIGHSLATLLLTVTLSNTQVLDKACNDPSDFSKQRVAVRCLCELIKQKPNFNFRSNILAAIVKTLQV